MENSRLSLAEDIPKGATPLTLMNLRLQNELSEARYGRSQSKCQIGYCTISKAKILVTIQLIVTLNYYPICLFGIFCQNVALQIIIPLTVWYLKALIDDWHRNSSASVEDVLFVSFGNCENNTLLVKLLGILHGTLFYSAYGNSLCLE